VMLCSTPGWTSDKQRAGTEQARQTELTALNAGHCSQNVLLFVSISRIIWLYCKAQEFFASLLFVL